MSTYERGDYIKVEFRDEATGVGEWDVGAISGVLCSSVQV